MATKNELEYEKISLLLTKKELELEQFFQVEKNFRLIVNREISLFLETYRGINFAQTFAFFCFLRVYFYLKQLYFIKKEQVLPEEIELELYDLWEQLKATKTL